MGSERERRAVLREELAGARRMFNIGWLCDAVGRDYARRAERSWFCALLRLRAQQGEAER